MTEHESTYEDMRNTIFKLDPVEKGIPFLGAHDVWGLVMDTGVPEGAYTVVALADGNASLYHSGGGGVIGGGEHAHISASATALVQQSNDFFALHESATVFSLPPPDNVAFFLLARSGVYTCLAPQEDLGEDRHRMSSLFYSVHELLSMLTQLGYGE